MDLYTKTYHPRKPNFISIDGFEIPVLLPDQPAEKYMRNYNLSTLKQKFTIDEIPRDIMAWDNTRKEAFIAAQWHKRFNGEWWLIKGQPIYITGPMWYFMNAWEMEKGGRADFRMEAVDWFQVWDHIVMDHNCFGMLQYKSRREGATEKALCALTDMTTKYRKSRFGIQSRDDEAAYDNYYRIVEANRKMHPWFKPVNKGNDAPEKRLHFTYPSKAVTHKNFSDEKGLEFEDTTPALESMIDFEPTKEKKYDGSRLRCYLGDEYGKILPSKMDVLAQWNIIKQCLSKNNEREIIGKSIIPTTVEEFESGETVEVCRKLWEQSNPLARTEAGRTVTGLYRYFRSYEHGAPIDEWGFHDKKGARAFRQAQIKAYLAAGDLDSLTAFKRKQPETVEESLALPGEQCVLYPALLDIQKERIEEWKSHNALVTGVDGMIRYPQAIRGDFLWTSGFGSDVRFVPSEQGKFYVSGHPDIPNKRISSDGYFKPGNTGVFGVGIDPVDHKATKGSDLAIAVFKTYNPMAETNIEYVTLANGEKEITNKWQMKTNRFVCTYSNRPYNPDEAYEDCLKCCIYYGVPAYCERQKPGMMRYFERYGYNAYLLYKPSWVKIGAKIEKEAGQHQSTAFTSLWSDLLKTHVSDFIETYVHKQQIEVFRNYNGENAGSCDIVVASGMALVASRQYEIKYEREAAMPQGQASPFPFSTFPINN